jgi:hypothetical protein
MHAFRPRRSSPYSIWIRMAMVVAMAGAVPCARAGVLLSDSTFNTADWTSFTIPYIFLGKTTPGGTVGYSQSLSGGNSGSYLNLSLAQNNSYDTFGTQTNYDDFSGVLYAVGYTPSTQGAITSLQFSVDFKYLGGSGMGFEAVMEQNGNYFNDGTGEWVLPSSPSGWFNFTVNIDPNSFNGDNGRNSSGNLGTGINFSNSSSPIYFGVGVVEESAIAPLNVNAGVDNFSLAINGVPEPSGITFVASALGASGLVRLRRRRAVRR